MDRIFRHFFQRAVGVRHPQAELIAAGSQIFRQRCFQHERLVFSAVPAPDVGGEIERAAAAVTPESQAYRAGIYRSREAAVDQLDFRAERLSCREFSRQIGALQFYPVAEVVADIFVTASPDMATPFIDEVAVRYRQLVVEEEKRIDRNPFPDIDGIRFSFKERVCMHESERIVTPAS